MVDEGSIVQTVFYVLLLIVLGALYITAATYTFQFTNAVEPNIGDDATLRRNYHWTRFGGVMIGLLGALTLLPIVLLIVAAVGAGAAAAIGAGKSNKRYPVSDVDEQVLLSL
jgi:tetrahydromethanopterin S-methyltransferase subunit F